MNATSAISELFESARGHGDRMLPKVAIRRINLFGEIWNIRSLYDLANSPRMNALEKEILIESSERVAARIADLINELGGLASAW